MTRFNWRHVTNVCVCAWVCECVTSSPVFFGRTSIECITEWIALPSLTNTEIWMFLIPKNNRADNAFCKPRGSNLSAKHDLICVCVWRHIWTAGRRSVGKTSIHFAIYHRTFKSCLVRRHLMVYTNRRHCKFYTSSAATPEGHSANIGFESVTS